MICNDAQKADQFTEILVGSDVGNNRHFSILCYNKMITRLNTRVVMMIIIIMKQKRRIIIKLRILQFTSRNVIGRFARDINHPAKPQPPRGSAYSVTTK